MSAKAARRYSAALLSIAKEQSKTEAVLRDVELIHQAIHDSRELALFLKSNIINKSKKQAVISELFDGKVSELTGDFLGFLVTKKREDLLADITKSYLAEYNKQAGIVDAFVYYPFEMDEGQAKQMKTVLEQSTGKKINMVYKKDASLKGGLTVKIEDTVIDGSIKNKLKKLDSLLMGTTV